MLYTNPSVKPLENRFLIRKHEKAEGLVKRRGAGRGFKKDAGLLMFVFFVNALFLIMLIQVLNFF